MGGRCLHILKMKTAPQFFGQPRRNGRSNHAQNGNLHTITIDDFVRLQIRLTCGIVHNVGSQYGKLTLLYPTVINSMSGFNIMVSHIAHCIPHEVLYLGYHMSRNRIYEIVIIRSGLPLKDITVIYQNTIVSI